MEMPPPLSRPALSMFPSSGAQIKIKKSSFLIVRALVPFSVDLSFPSGSAPLPRPPSPPFPADAHHELLHCFQAQEIIARHLIALFGPNFRVSYATEALSESTVVTALCNCIDLQALLPCGFSSRQRAPDSHHHSFGRNLLSPRIFIARLIVEYGCLTAFTPIFLCPIPSWIPRILLPISSLLTWFFGSRPGHFHWLLWGSFKMMVPRS